MEIKNCYTGNGTVKVGISVKPYKCYDEYCNLQIVLVNLDNGKPFVSATHDLWNWCNTPKKADCPIDCGYLDTHNIPELPKIMEENGLGVFTGRVEIGQHGIEYPLYRFNFDKLHELCPNGLAEYFKKNNINDIKDFSVKVMDLKKKKQPITVKEYYDTYYKENKTDTVEQKVANYIHSRIFDDMECDDFFDDEEKNEMIEDYWNTPLTTKAIYNMELACERFYDTMLSTDLDYLIDDNYSWEELLTLIETRKFETIKQRILAKYGIEVSFYDLGFDEKTKPFIEKEEIIESVNKLYEGLNTVSTIEDLKTYFDKHNITNYYIYVTNCCFQSGYDNINAFARDCESLLSVEQIYIGDYGCLEEVKINFDEGRANSIYDITFCILYDGDLYADDITLYELKDYDFIPFTKDDMERD